MPLQDYIQQNRQSFEQTTMSSFDPDNYNPGTFGKFAGNLINNVTELLGLDKESQAKWLALPEEEKTKLIAMNGVSGALKYVKEIPELYHVSPAKFTKFEENKPGGYNLQAYGLGTYTTDDIMDALGKHQRAIRDIRQIPSDVPLNLYMAEHKPAVMNKKVLQGDQNISDLLIDDPKFAEELLSNADGLNKFSTVDDALARYSRNLYKSYMQRGVDARMASDLAEQETRRLAEQHNYAAHQIPMMSEDLRRVNEYRTLRPQSLNITGSTEILE